MRTWLIAVFGAVSACALLDSPAGERLEEGTWGGKNAGLIVSDTGAHLHIGCTLGDVIVPIILDEHGRFDVAESHNLTAFPISAGVYLPARLTGWTADDLLSLTLTVDDTVNHRTVVFGPLRLRLGSRPELGPCPICVTPTLRTAASGRTMDRARKAVAMLGGE